MTERVYFVYILASRSRVLYVGVTSNLLKRVFEHRDGLIAGFTKKYRVHRLVHFEAFRDVRAAIAREKELKEWRRERKVALIEIRNPCWGDLAEGKFGKDRRVNGFEPF
jgi:putative endonuclease